MISFNKIHLSFVARLVAGFIATFFLIVGANAQGTSKFKEGADYQVLPAAQPLDSKGKVEVIEFFWYGCPHCFDFEPKLSAWVKRQNKDVLFRRIPVAFSDDLLPHNQLFYALEALGKAEALNQKVMNAIHIEKKRLLNESEIADWVVAQGIDRNTFLASYRAFTTVTKARGALKIFEAYGLDGVPSIAIQGRYITAPSIAGTEEKAIAVMDYLVDKVRKDKYK